MLNERNKLYRFHNLLLFGAFMVGIILSGCAAPIGVTIISPQESYLESVKNVLGSGMVSNDTKVVLQRYNLLETLEKEDPAQVIKEIHEISRNDQRRDLLFALSELSYFQGTRLAAESVDYKRILAKDFFLQSAVYAYFYLLDTERETPPTAYDQRFRETCDLYNQSLWQAFSGSANGSLLFSVETRNLTGGPLPLTVKYDNLAYSYDTFDGFLPSDSLAVRGFAVRNQTAGLGMPLIGLIRKSKDSPNGGALPLTGLLRLTGDYSDYLAGKTAAVLELFSTLDTGEVRMNSHLIPLQTDITTPLAYRLNDARLWSIGERRFLTGAEVQQRVLLIQPYEPGRIPVVFVHGTASSPVWWAEMANSLRADQQIRKHFQFWFYQYNSSNMVLLSAAELREAIIALVNQLDPQHQDSALENMVVIGHSQGGLLTKTTVVDSGDKLWNAISNKDIDKIEIKTEIRNFIRRLVFFQPMPFVKRVIFISTPHRGSYLTKGWVRSLVRQIISIPSNILNQGDFLGELGTHLKLPESIRGSMPTSIDGMSKENPLLQELAVLPIAKGVAAHSIIAVKSGMDIATGNDGVVEYRSAHLDGVESELIVRADHSCQDHPFTIEEVRRILLQHIGVDEGHGRLPTAETEAEIEIVSKLPGL